MNDLKALGDRAVKTKNWKWLPGMMTLDGHRIAAAFDGGLAVGEMGNPVTAGHTATTALPDLGDVGTLNLLLNIVREHRPDFEYTEDVEAVVAALESAP